MDVSKGVALTVTSRGFLYRELEKESYVEKSCKLTENSTWNDVLCYEPKLPHLLNKNSVDMRDNWQSE